MWIVVVVDLKLKEDLRNLSSQRQCNNISGVNVLTIQGKPRGYDGFSLSARIKQGFTLPCQ